jgi:hypothetical protein
MSANDLENFDVAATYLPRAFSIELKAFSFEKPTAGSGIPTFNAATFPIFMHELAHLVQDRATFRGIMDFMDLWDQVEAAALYVRDGDAIVPLPIVEAKSGLYRLGERYKWAVEVAALREHREPKRAWTNERFWAFEKYSVTFRPLTLSGRRIEYPFVTVDLVDNTTGEQYKHPIGAWEIKEAYSVAVGLLHGGQEKSPADWFEYLIVERILAHYFGPVSAEQMIAICHWALQDLSPANTIFTLIERLQEEYEGLPSFQEIYDLGRAEAFGREFENNSRSVLQQLRQLEESMQAQAPDLGNLFRWFRIHAERLLELHLDPARRFPLDTFLCARSADLGPEERRAGLRSLFSEVEVPLIIWPDGDFYSISNTPGAVDAVFLNRSIFDLFQHLWNENNPRWQCPLHRGCTLPLKDDVDCLAEPWKKNAVQPTCPYGAAAKVLGFADATVPTFIPFDPRDGVA